MDQGKSAGMLRELMDYDGESGHRPLTDWELRFIQTLEMRLEHLGAFLTGNQQAKLAEVWEGVFG